MGGVAALEIGALAGILGAVGAETGLVFSGEVQAPRLSASGPPPSMLERLAPKVSSSVAGADFGSASGGVEKGSEARFELTPGGGEVGAPPSISAAKKAAKAWAFGLSASATGSSVFGDGAEGGIEGSPIGSALFGGAGKTGGVTTGEFALAGS